MVVQLGKQYYGPTRWQRRGWPVSDASTAMVRHGRPGSYDLFNMPLSLNLRHDLATMSDAQLMERVEQTWQAYAQTEAEAWPHKLFASFRGPIRHP
jgi:hypothetical protein